MNIDPCHEGDLHETGGWRKLLVGFLLYSFSGAVGTKYHRLTGLAEYNVCVADIN